MSELSNIDKKTLDEYMNIVSDSVGAIIKNEVALEPNFIPHKILFRNEERKKLMELITPLFRNQHIPNIVLWGDPGTGKTAFMKHIEIAIRLLCEKMNIKKIPTIYIDCKGASEYYILTEIMLGIGMKVSRRKENTQQQYTLLKKRLEQLQQHIFVILDDFDKTNKGVNKDCLFNFTRMRFFNFTMIANNINFLHELPDYTKSSLRHERIQFEQYKPEQLRGIAQQRIGIALKYNPFTEDALKAIVYLSSLEGDARYLLSLLQTSVKIAEQQNLKTIESSIVREAKKKIAIEEIGDLIRNIPYLHTFTLFLASDSNGEDLPTTNELYKKYVKYTEKYKNIPSTSYRTFTRYLQALEKRGILLKHKGKPNRWDVVEYYDKDHIYDMAKKEIVKKNKMFGIKNDLLNI